MHQLDFFYLLLFGTKHHVKGGIGDKFVFSCGIGLLYHLPPQKFASSSMPRLRHRGRWKLRWRGEKEENSVSRFQLFHPWPHEVDSTMAKVGSQIPLGRLLTFHIDFFTTLWALKIQKRYGGKKVPVRPRSGSFFLLLKVSEGQHFTCLFRPGTMMLGVGWIWIWNHLLCVGVYTKKKVIEAPVGNNQRWTI